MQHFHVQTTIAEGEGTGGHSSRLDEVCQTRVGSGKRDGSKFCFRVSSLNFLFCLDFNSSCSGWSHFCVGNVQLLVIWLAGAHVFKSDKARDLINFCRQVNGCLA